MKTVAEVIGVFHSDLIDRMRERPKKRIGRPPLPDDKLVAEIKAVIGELPTYGYRRVHAILKRQALAAGLKPPNHKRVYRVMKVHGLLLDRHAGGVERRHDGRVAVDARNRRWCSDGFEIGCDNGERVRVAFALDCCDREAMSFLATTSGVSGEDVRDLMLAAVEHRFGLVNRLPVTIEWCRQWQLLRRRPDPQVRSRHRPRTENDANPKSTEQWNGRSLRPYDQA